MRSKDNEEVGLLCSSGNDGIEGPLDDGVVVEFFAILEDAESLEFMDGLDVLRFTFTGADVTPSSSGGWMAPVVAGYLAPLTPFNGRVQILFIVRKIPYNPLVLGLS